MSMSSGWNEASMDRRAWSHRGCAGMLLLALVTFSRAMPSELMLVLSVDCWNAPRRPRKTETWLMAASMILLAAAELPQVQVLTPYGSVRVASRPRASYVALND